MVWQGKYSKAEVNAGFIDLQFSHDGFRTVFHKTGSPRRLRNIRLVDL